MNHIFILAYIVLAVCTWLNYAHAVPVSFMLALWVSLVCLNEVMRYATNIIEER
jgi:hypothetical protein